MILLSPDVIALTAGAVRAGLGALVFFLTPPVGALSALLAFTAARRVVPRRGRLGMVDLLSAMIVSSDWSSLFDMVATR